MNARSPRWVRLCLYYGLGFLGGSLLMIAVGLTIGALRR